MKRKIALYCITWLTSFTSGMSPSLLAQLDTTGFPLDIGNKWFYRYSYTQGPYSTVHVRVKEIIDTTMTGTRIVRTVRLSQDSTLRTEQWSVTNRGFFINSTLVYNDTLTHDTSWTDFLFGSSSYAYQLRRVTLFGSNNKCQIYLTSYSGQFGSSSTDQRIALGVGPYYDYWGGYGGEDPRWDQYYSLIGLLRSGQLFGDSLLTLAVEQGDLLPASLVLHQNYPNPFNPTTTIKFQIPTLSLVTLKVFDLLGREVATLVNEEMKAGSYERTFEGSGVSSGIYFYQLRSGSFIQTKKLILLR